MDRRWWALVVPCRHAVILIPAAKGKSVLLDGAGSAPPAPRAKADLRTLPIPTGRLREQTTHCHVLGSRHESGPWLTPVLSPGLRTGSGPPDCTTATCRALDVHGENAARVGRKRRRLLGGLLPPPVP